MDKERKTAMPDREREGLAPLGLETQEPREKVERAALLTELAEQNVEQGQRRRKKRGGALLRYGSCLILGLLVGALCTMFAYRSMQDSEFLRLRVGQGKEQLELGISAEADEATQQNFRKLGGMLETVRDNFYEEPSTKVLLEALAQGFPAQMGNPYTFYMSKEQHELWESSGRGDYVGIGATVRNDRGRYIINEVLADSGAEAAGLKVGDEILSVGEQPASSFQNLEDMVSLVRGEEGTSVTLEILRPDGRQERLSIERRRIQVQEVSSQLIGKDIGYMSLREFSRTLPEQFSKALKKLKDRGAKKLIFDMRGNPGGDANALVQVLDELLDAGEVARIVGRENGQDMDMAWTTKDGGIFAEGTAISILLDSNTASAAELFSGCLRDRVGAQLLGQKSFGKGSGTVTYSFEDGSAMNVTIFRYVLPGGEWIEGEGLKPDQELELPEDPSQLVYMEKQPTEEQLQRDPWVQQALKSLEGR